MTVTKKIWSGYFEDVLYHNKRFEIRKDEDHLITGDNFILAEWDPEKKRYTGRRITCAVLYVFRSDNHIHDFGLKPGYCVIGFAVVG